MNWFYGGLGGLIVLGVLIFFYLAGRRKYRDPTAAPKYEQIRDKLTVREPEIVKEEGAPTPEIQVANSLMSLAIGIVVVSITIVIGIYVLSALQASFVPGSAVANASQGALDALKGATP